MLDPTDKTPETPGATPRPPGTAHLTDEQMRVYDKLSDRIEGHRVKRFHTRRHEMFGKPVDRWSVTEVYSYYSALHVEDEQPPPSGATRGQDLGIIKLLVKEFGTVETVDFLNNGVVNWTSIRFNVKAANVPRPNLKILMKYRADLMADTRRGGTCSSIDRTSNAGDFETVEQSLARQQAEWTRVMREING